MPIYRYTTDAIHPIAEATFSELGIAERADLQRLLRDQIDIISPDTLVIAEEFANWDESKRRIDLLGIDRDANIVVIELKRTEDGGHMELQAIRYAAMVSTLTFDHAVEVFENYLEARKDNRDAKQVILDFLNWDEPQDEDFATDVRIVLASAEFSKELTTAVLWLCDRAIDIRCVRLRPYGSKSETFLDVQQVIPLPEAEDYQIKVREKKQVERVARKEKTTEPWNGRDFYVSLGEFEDANWDDCRKYGFVCGSGGRFYTRTLDHLEPGSRVFVNIPKRGFVGIGIVEERTQTVDKFTVQHDGKVIPLLDAPLSATDMSRNIGDPDQCSNLVRIKWLKTFPRDKPFWTPGLFASQHTACKLRDSFTIQKVCEHFAIPAEEQ